MHSVCWDESEWMKRLVCWNCGELLGSCFLVGAWINPWGWSQSVSWRRSLVGALWHIPGCSRNEGSFRTATAFRSPRSPDQNSRHAKRTLPFPASPAVVRTRAAAGSQLTSVKMTGCFPSASFFLWDSSADVQTGMTKCQTASSGKIIKCEWRSVCGSQDVCIYV